MTNEALPTTLNIDGLDREVVSAIYVPPLYGSLVPTWICVVRWEQPAPGDLAEFLVFTVVLTDDGTHVYDPETKAGSYHLAQAHEVAWRRVAFRYGLT